MTWVKLDDQLPEHPKAEGVSSAAMWLHVAGICYCNRQLTDGEIPKTRVARLVTDRRPEALAAELVTAGLWHDKGDSYEVHDYLDFQPSKEKVENDRVTAKERQRKSRARHGVTGSVTDGVTSDAPARPGPVPVPPVVEVDRDHDDLSLSNGSSWSDDDAFTEAGRTAARCSGVHFDDDEHFRRYAAGAAGRIRRERGHLLAGIRERGLSLEQAAFTLTQRDAVDLTSYIEHVFGDDELVPADEIEVNR